MLSHIQSLPKSNDNPVYRTDFNLPFFTFLFSVVTDEEKVSKMEGDSLTLHTGLTQIQCDDVIEWSYEAEDNHIAEINRGTIKISAGADGRFRSKLMLGDNTGDLTISNIRTIHSGLYILKISSSSSKSGCGTKSTTRTKCERFIVTVSGEYI